MSRDELDAFDSIDHSDQTEPEHWAKIDEPERERPRRGRRALIVALLAWAAYRGFSRRRVEDGPQA